MKYSSIIKSLFDRSVLHLGAFVFYLKLGHNLIIHTVTSLKLLAFLNMCLSLKLFLLFIFFDAC